MAKRVAPGPSGLEHLGWPALSKKDAERVLRIVRGQNGNDYQRDANVLHEAALSVQWIQRKSANTRSAGERKAALQKVANNIRAVIKSIEDLPTATQYELDPVFSDLPIETKNSLVTSALSLKALRTQALTNGVQQWALQPGTLHQFLDRVLDRTLALAEKITVRRSGGKQRGPGGGRIEAVQKRAAAECAINMLLTWGKVPTKTDGGPYYKLTALLFTLATGNIGDVDVEDACIRVYKELLGSRDEVDQMQREGRLWAKVSSRMFEMFQMMLDESKVFEDSD